MSTHPTSDQLQADHLIQLHAQLQADIEALHEKEASLKIYETRLRALVERTGTATPFQMGAAADGSVADLDAAWDKFHRTQALFAAERRAFNDERIAGREQMAALRQREEEVARREAWIELCEKEIATVAATTIKAEPPPAKRSLTTAPFLAVKQIFSRGN